MEEWLDGGQKLKNTKNWENGERKEKRGKRRINGLTGKGSSIAITISL